MRHWNASVSSPRSQSTAVVRRSWKGDLRSPCSFYCHFSPFYLAFILSLVQVLFRELFLFCFCFVCGQNLDVLSHHLSYVCTSWWRQSVCLSACRRILVNSSTQEQYIIEYILKLTPQLSFGCGFLSTLLCERYISLS